MPAVDRLWPNGDDEGADLADEDADGDDIGGMRRMIMMIMMIMLIMMIMMIMMGYVYSSCRAEFRLNSLLWSRDS